MTADNPTPQTVTAHQLREWLARIDAGIAESISPTLRELIKRAANLLDKMPEATPAAPTLNIDAGSAETATVKANAAPALAREASPDSEPPALEEFKDWKPEVHLQADQWTPRIVHLADGEELIGVSHFSAPQRAELRKLVVAAVCAATRVQAAKASGEIIDRLRVSPSEVEAFLDGLDQGPVA